MKGPFLFSCIFFLLKHKVAYADKWTQIFTESEYLQGFTLESSKEDTVFACYSKCEDSIICASVNINLKEKTCELKYSTKKKNPKRITRRSDFIYMEIRDALGSTPLNPIQSCKWFKNLDNHAKSGVYWMKFNDPSSTPFQVFCEMTIDGGGWTLVYSYTFTNYNAFGTFGNAVTPIPNWPLYWFPSGWSPQSTTTPLSESSYSAMDFALWKKIGNEFLIKPNISNWVVCVEGTGSFVNWRAGSLSCRIIKAITRSCTTVVPLSLRLDPYGPCLFTSGLFGYYVVLDGKTATNFPTHDPCGSNSANNHLTNVRYPGGVLYLR